MKPQALPLQKKIIERKTKRNKRHTHVILCQDYSDAAEKKYKNVWDKKKDTHFSDVKNINSSKPLKAGVLKRKTD